MNGLFLPVAGLIRTYLAEVCLGITAVTMMLAGPTLNGFVQRVTIKLHWFFRYAVFVFMCAVGYGVLTQILYRTLKWWFGQQRSLALVLITIGIYLGLAFFAKKQGHI